MSSEELKPTYQSKTYCVHEHPYAYATLTDFAPGKGMIQIWSDWGCYGAFWGSMSGRTVAQFLVDCNASYIESNLSYKLRYQGMKVEAHGRLTKFMAQCWPALRELIQKEIQSGQSDTRSECITDEGPLMPLAGL